MDIGQKYLSPELNAKATAAFRDNTRLAEMSLEERETAAQAYEQIAAITTGKAAELARLFNLGASEISARANRSYRPSSARFWR